MTLTRTRPTPSGVPFRFLPALVLVASAVVVVGGAPGASARTVSARTVSAGTVSAGTASARTAATCASGDLTGTYHSSLTVTGICYVVNGSSVVVDGNLTVAHGAMLDAVSPGGPALLGSALPGNLTVTGNVTVKSDAALLLGWCTEPNSGVGSHNCDAAKTGSSDDQVGGSITAVGALAVIVHNVAVSGGITLAGGGGGAVCSTPTLFTEDSDPAVNGSQSIGYDFDPVNYSDLESNTVGKSIRVTGLNSCWFGALRDAVTGSFVFSHNTMNDSDADEVVGNEINHNMACRDDSPAVQFGDSGSGPNVVSGTASGECASPISVPAP